MTETKKMPNEPREIGIRFPLIALSCILFMVVVSGYSATLTAAPSVASPTMPSSWEVISDVSFSAADIKPVAARLGGTIAALRNTIYVVDGKRVQLNTILAADEESADEIMNSLRRIKSEEALCRRELIIYEFVGPNDVLPQIRAGRAYLEAGGS
jgi:hypothetical protein